MTSTHVALSLVLAILVMCMALMLVIAIGQLFFFYRKGWIGGQRRKPEGGTP